MTPIETAVAVGGGLVAVGFPLLGLVVHRLTGSAASTNGQRGEDLPPAHGRDRRL